MKEEANKRSSMSSVYSAKTDTNFPFKENKAAKVEEK